LILPPKPFHLGGVRMRRVHRTNVRTLPNGLPHIWWRSLPARGVPKKPPTPSMTPPSTRFCHNFITERSKTTGIGRERSEHRCAGTPYKMDLYGIARDRPGPLAEGSNPVGATTETLYPRGFLLPKASLDHYPTTDELRKSLWPTGSALSPVFGGEKFSRVGGPGRLRA
jgi:hypothetical protein